MTTCNLCEKNLKNILITVDAKRVCFEGIQREHYNNNYKFYFYDEKYITCLNCFKQFSIWKHQKNKVKFFRNRSLGIKNKKNNRIQYIKKRNIK